MGQKTSLKETNHLKDYLCNTVCWNELEDQSNTKKDYVVVGKCQE